MTMDSKSKYLIAGFIVLVLISVYLTYKRSFVDQNFEIISEEETLEQEQ